VRDILLEVARDHPAVLSNPAPFVFFENFGDSALNLILFVYLSNVNQSFAVRTDLRIAILKAFRKHGIEIPYPQTDVHLRDLDWVKEALRTRRNGREHDANVKRRSFEAESQEPDTDGTDSDGH
jgi:small-conductance mechanosensitive channel